MAFTGVYRKTEKGVAQLAARTIKLASMTRMAMVMIDGHRPVAELAGKLGGEAQAQAALNELFAHELIEAVAHASGSAAPLADAPAAAAVATAQATAQATAAPGMPFDALRTWASRTVSQTMGPMGDDYGLAIERAKTLDELSAAAARARDGIDGVAGSRRAETFWADFQKNRGTGA